MSAVAGADMRADFVLLREGEKSAEKSAPAGSAKGAGAGAGDGTGGHAAVVEVKTVVDTDYDPAVAREEGDKPTFLGRRTPYARAAIFPWGDLFIDHTRRTPTPCTFHAVRC